jgi:DNA transformation protein
MGSQNTRRTTPKGSAPALRLEDIPNIGKSIASDLRSLGILNPDQLATRDPLQTYLALTGTMGHRHDPCVLYTLMAARHYLDSGASIPWWKFTAQGKKLLAALPK